LKHGREEERSQGELRGIREREGSRREYVEVEAGGGPGAGS